MANSWLRLWHDMPTDPKWRTIAKVSGQSIGNVMAVYIHMLVCASNATERGRTQSFNSEDVASALDMETEQIEQIVSAMQGRVLDGDLVKGWETRQVAREDGSAERAKAWREAKKQAKKQDSDETERNRTQAERKQTPDTDTDTDIERDKSLSSTSAPPKLPDCPHLEILSLFAEHLPTLAQPRPESWDGKRAGDLRARWRWVLTKTRKTGERYAENKEQGLAWFARFFAYVADSDFLMGRAGNFSVTLDWLVNQTNFSKVLDGNYANRTEVAA